IRGSAMTSAALTPPGGSGGGSAPHESAKRELLRGNSLRADAWRRFRKNRLASGSAVFLAILVLASFAGPLISPYAYEKQDLAYGAKGPSLAHWFGTDFLGRDLLTRVLSGGQVSLAIGLAAAIVSLSIGA